MSALPPKADVAERQLDVRFVPMLLKKSPSPRSITRNGEFQNPTGQVLESKSPIEGYFDENLLSARGQNRFSTASAKKGDISSVWSVRALQRYTSSSGGGCLSN